MDIVHAVEANPSHIRRRGSEVDRASSEENLPDSKEPGSQDWSTRRLEPAVRDTRIHASLLNTCTPGMPRVCHGFPSRRGHKGECLCACDNKFGRRRSFMGVGLSVTAPRQEPKLEGMEWGTVGLE